VLAALDDLEQDPTNAFQAFAADPSDSLPDYAALVALPMDLNLLRRRLDQGYYRHTSAVARDAQLVYDNCAGFNVEGSEIVAKAFELWMKIDAAALPPSVEWVQCERCDKWRKLPPGEPLPDNDIWHCELNTWNIGRSACDAPQEDDDEAQEDDEEDEDEDVLGLGAASEPPSDAAPSNDHITPLVTAEASLDGKVGQSSARSDEVDGVGGRVERERRSPTRSKRSGPGAANGGGVSSLPLTLRRSRSSPVAREAEGGGRNRRREQKSRPLYTEVGDEEEEEEEDGDGSFASKKVHRKNNTTAAATRASNQSSDKSSRATRNKHRLDDDKNEEADPSEDADEEDDDDEDDSDDYSRPKSRTTRKVVAKKAPLSPARSRSTRKAAKSSTTHKYHDEEEEDDNDDDDDSENEPSGHGGVERTPWKEWDACVGFEEQVMTSILDCVASVDEHGTFAEPVPLEFVPGYAEVIEEPMDLGTMRCKLETGMYATLQDFRKDLELVIDNTLTFNAEGSEYYQEALELAAAVPPAYESAVTIKSSAKRPRRR
jgi:hypothetical protein